ncbi:hypothetical protein M404DRAFT_32901 [Pisolithus tinctorius Marx 270]|uniref:Uncharacterized protein n=1 Tax=Pisolithus tinctorius Marx 270 TaxID=870435 RepID=A0A0C3NMN0_PISTI|nr:hypothetical protein M404DRAFT_32901 [Pisolithus tinctorius Marx 270]
MSLHNIQHRDGVSLRQLFDGLSTYKLASIGSKVAHLVATSKFAVVLLFVAVLAHESAELHQTFLL